VGETAGAGLDALAGGGVEAEFGQQGLDGGGLVLVVGQGDGLPERVGGARREVG
jgi:hypothetical protein